MIFHNIVGKNRKKKESISYTVSACVKCHAIKKQKFAKGDVVFGRAKHACTSCGGIMTIEQIFSETPE